MQIGTKSICPLNRVLWITESSSPQQGLMKRSSHNPRMITARTPYKQVDGIEVGTRIKEKLELPRKSIGSLFRVPSLAPARKPDPPPVYLGVMLILAGVTSVALCVYTTVIAKIFPPTGYPLVEMMASDWYYCLLFPLTLPVTVVAIYLHWLSMKLFKHA